LLERSFAGLKARCAESDAGQVEDRTIFINDEDMREQPALGPRLAGLALLCVTLFALATLVGLFANAYA
jgi:hypothetical protein